MKRLLIALVAAVAVSTGFAKLTYTQGFEGESYNPSTDFVPSVANEDASEIANHGTAPSVTVPYNFGGFGDKYYELDTGNATLWYTNEGSAPYFDMVMQFNPSATTPTLDAETKIAVYVNASSNLVVLAGNEDGGERTHEPNITLAPGEWARLTISTSEGKFFVRLNGNLVDNAGYYPRSGTDAAINSIGFKGSGSLDDFVARTTDPFFDNSNMAANIGGENGERYATYTAALVDALAASTPATITLADATTMDGTAAKPYQIATADDLVALANAVDANAAVRSLNFVQTANIDMASAGPFAGIGTFAKVPTSGKPFVGTYDGQGYTISNVQRAGGDTQGIFNQVGVGGVVENLVVSNMYWDAELSGEYGFAIVGNAGGGATLRNLTAAGTFGSAGKPSTHNIAGIVVRLCGGATSGVATTIDSCTNNATIYGGYTKLGGICAIVQQQTGFVDGKVVFENCANNGTLVCKRTNSDVTGNAGIVGYITGTNVELTDCYGNGVITNEDGANTDKDGALVGWTYSGTIKDNGGNSAPSNKKMIGTWGNATETGFQYATVDNGIATTIAPPYTLAKDTTYLLEGNVADSATPVFTLAAAGDTIAFDTALGYTFAGTVAADTTTLVLADPVTDGTVTTYAATAGVASVDNVAYANFADAVAALDGATDDYVTLLADVAYEFSYNTTLKVKAGNHTFTPAKTADDVVLSESTVEGITTYTAVEGVAAVRVSVSLPWKWYATFEGAYAAALADSGNALMEIKITDDFTPNISVTYNHFYSLRFEDVRADKSEGLTINLKNAAGTAYMGSSRYFFPDNAKLVLAADWAPWTQGLATGGTLEIPEGVTVSNFGSYVALEGLSSIVGAGTIAPSAAVSYYMLRDPTKVVPTSLRDNTWTGTLVVTGAVEGTGAAFNYVWNLGNYGNSGSTIRFNGVTTYLDSGTHSVGTIELVGDGLTINGNYSNGTWTFPGALTGSGSLNISIANASGTDLKAVKFTGDASEFAGSIDFGANANTYVQFGSEGVASNELAAKRIITGDDAEVTVASGKTWKADAFMLHGNVTLDGSLRNIDDTDAGVVWNNHSSAVFTVNAAGLFEFGNYESWTGTYVVNHSLASAATAFIIPTAENATTVINGDENGEFVGFPATGNDPNGPPTVKGKIVLNADWTTGDGWSTEAKATTFASLSGSGDLTVNDKNNYSYQLWYNITKLDGYTGTLGGRNGKFVIGQVNVAEMPTDGARVVKTACGTYGKIAGDLKLYVAGVDTGKTLTYVANGADGAGLYYFEPKVYVAKIEGGASYETLADAVTNATSGATVTLLSDIKLNARVEPNLGANTTLAINLGGFTITREGTSGNGSVFDVKSGNVVITNGTIDCTQENGGAEIDAITIRTGNLTLADLAITVNSKNGACVYPFAGATVTINGGTYRNNTAEEYQYKTGWMGMAVNQANVATQLITIYGGKFWQVDPKAGDDSGLCTSFLASGKTTTLVDGYWTVGDAATPVEPGQKSTEYDTAEAATNAMAIVEVAVPSDVDSALDAGQKADYVAMFEKKVVDNGDGTYSVAVEMKDEVVAAVQTAVDTATETTLSEVLKVAAGADANVSVTTKPGLYYAIAVGTSLPLTAPASEAYEMATDTTKTLKVTKPTTGTAAFFRVYCSETK